jgi:hypothetical protein
MANATPIRIGQVNGTGVIDEMFLKVFGGEVMVAFENHGPVHERGRARHHN